MSTSRIANVRIAGIASAVPEPVVTFEDDAKRFGEDEMRRLVKNTGVRKRHVAYELCASDLAQRAAERLLRELDWSPDSIDILVFVTQCPDYPAPSTACLLQTRMGLKTGCAAFDVNLGCSGYPYGLSLVANFLSNGMKRGLLLVGDTSSRAASPHDRAVVPLFGDAASATALEFHSDAPRMDFVFGTDGRGAKHLNARAGAYRHPFTAEAAEMRKQEDGVLRKDVQTYMNGAEVLTFAITSVPQLITEIKSHSGWGEDEIDLYVFHQASAFMLKTVGRSARIPPSKIVLGVENFGNASVASIPLAISSELQSTLTSSTKRLILAGFGIGWSWAAAAIECGPLIMPPVLIVPDVHVEPEF